MKKIFLYAYDRQNLGDDLFVHAIAKRYPKAKLYMWTSRQNRKTYACLPNVKVVDEHSWFVRFLLKLRPSLLSRYRAWLENRCDAVVYIGGSIFIEYDNWKQIFEWWDYEAKNRPFYVLGANFGPYHTPAYRDKAAEIFGNMKDICFRDRYSYELFSDVPTVRYAPDILLGYPMPHVEVQDKQVFVSVIDCAGRDGSHGLASCDEQYVSNMASLLREYRSDGYRVVLASFCKEEGDERGIEKILNAMECENDPSVTTLFYDGTNADALTEAIAQSGFVIATRFHATILALAAGRPVLPIIYSDKTANVLKDMEFNGVTYDLRKDEIWDYPFVCKSCADDKEQDMRTMINQSTRHFARLDKVME